MSAFIGHVTFAEGVNFHPDTPFADYICYADGSPTYTAAECARRERLLSQCFALMGDGVYETGLRLVRPDLFSPAA